MIIKKNEKHTFVAQPILGFPKSLSPSFRSGYRRFVKGGDEVDGKLTNLPSTAVGIATGCLPEYFRSPFKVSRRLRM